MKVNNRRLFDQLNLPKYLRGKDSLSHFLLYNMVFLYPVEGFRGEMCSILLYGRRGKMSSTTDVDTGTAIRLVYEVGVFLFSDPVLKD